MSKFTFKRAGIVTAVISAIMLSTLEVSPSYALDAPQANAQSSDPRMVYASNLIYRSTAAQQIENSDNPQAKKRYKEAQALYVKANKGGTAAQTKEWLDEALQKMFAAVKLAEPEEVRNKKLRRDFAKKKDSVKALLNAHNLVAKEKNKSSQGKKMYQQVSKLLSQADELYQQGNYSQGKGILDGALNIVKNSIEQMRGGDTLVKSLKFDSKKDEYAYEVDRNDTHQMLIKVLLSEKRKKSPDLDKRITSALATAGEYRKKAEKAAAGNDYQAAVEWLEKATMELVKVIRRGGIYIPSA